MTKLGLLVCALASSLGAVGALEGEKTNENEATMEIKEQKVESDKQKNQAMGAKKPRKLQYGGGAYGARGNGYNAAGAYRNGNGGGGGFVSSTQYGGGGGGGGGYYGGGYTNGNGRGGNGGYYYSSSRSKGMKGSMKGSSSYDYSYYGGGGNGGDRYDDYYFYDDMYRYDDMYYPGNDFLDFYGGPCVHVVEKIHFDFPPATDIFAPNGGVFGDIGTMYIWAMVTVRGFGTLDGVCLRTWPDVDGTGGDGLCNFVLTDPETGDQLLFGGKLESITPGGALAITGGSGSVSGVFGDMYVHADVDDGDDVLDFAEDYFVDGLLGIIHCPQKFGNQDQHYPTPYY